VGLTSCADELRHGPFPGTAQKEQNARLDRFIENRLDAGSSSN
jgi:hypothetical protein